MTRDEALVLLRSGQMPESRYIQVCDENGWGLGTQLLNEAGNALDDKDAEIKRLRAEIDRLLDIQIELLRTIADMTESLKIIPHAVDAISNAIAKAEGHLPAPPSRPQGGKE